MPDHIHIFVGFQPSISISDLVRDVKNNSSKFINEKGWINGKFSWQEGYGAFSYSHSHIENVYNYILNQEKHHQKKSFKEEYLDFLKKFEVEYDEKYLFEWIEWLDIKCHPYGILIVELLVSIIMASLTGFYKRWQYFSIKMASLTGFPECWFLLLW